MSYLPEDLGCLLYIRQEINMRKPSHVLLVLMLLTGCASTPQVTEEISWQQAKAQIPADNVLLYVVRPSSYLGSAQRYKITINGKHAADIETGKYFPQLVPPGTVRISAETIPSLLNFGLGLAFMGKPELILKAGSGEIVFINVEVAFSGGPKLTVVESEIGERLVKNASKTKAKNRVRLDLICYC